MHQINSECRFYFYLRVKTQTTANSEYSYMLKGVETDLYNWHLKCVFTMKTHPVCEAILFNCTSNKKSLLYEPSSCVDPNEKSF